MSDSSQLFDAHVSTYRASIERSAGSVRQDLDFFAEAKVHHLRQSAGALGVDLAASSVLDVGCGPGIVDRHLRSAVRSLVGVDVSAGMVAEAARANPGVAYHHADGTTLPFADGHFDVAFACCVVHHVEPSGWDAFLAELLRVVRPGGVAVVIEHNPLNPLTRRMVRTCPFDADAVLARPARIRAGLARANRSPARTDYVMFVPTGGARTRRAERLLRGLPIGAQYAVGVVRDQRRMARR